MAAVELKTGMAKARLNRLSETDLAVEIGSSNNSPEDGAIIRATSSQLTAVL